MSKWFLFADESGHTGGKYLSDAQPFFVSGGWLVAEDKLETLRERVVAIRDRVPGKFKGAKLAKSKPDVIVSMISEFREIGGAIPLVAVYEKRVSLTFHVLDIFLDPEFNKAASSLPLDERDRRRQYARDLDELLTDDLLACFEDAIRSHDTALLVEALDTITALVKRHADAPPIGAMLAHAPRDPACWRDCLEYSNTTSSTGLAINPRALSTILFCADRFTRLVGGRLHVVHHEQVEFADMFCDLSDSLGDGRNHLLAGATGERAFAELICPTLDSFQLMDDLSEPLIQAADLLVSSTRKMLQELDNSRWWSGNLARALRQILVHRDEQAPAFRAFLSNSNRRELSLRLDVQSVEL